MCVLKPRVQKWVNFSKNGHFWPFFSGNFRDFRGFGGFPGEKFPGNRGIFRRNFPRGFSRNRLYLCVHPKKTGKKRPFFPGISRGFPGGFSGDFPGTFFGKNPDFPRCSSRFTTVYPAPQRAFWKKPPNFRKSSRGFPEFPGIPGKNFPKFPEIPSDRFSGKIFRIFRIFGDAGETHVPAYIPVYPYSLKNGT